MAPLATTRPAMTAEIEATEATVVIGDAADPQDDHIVTREMKMPMPRAAATETVSAKIDMEEPSGEEEESEEAETAVIGNGTVTEVLEETIAVMMAAGHRDATATYSMTDAVATDGTEVATEEIEAIEQAATEEAIAILETGMTIFSPRIAVVAVQPHRPRSESPPRTLLTLCRSWSASGG